MRHDRGAVASPTKPNKRRLGKANGYSRSPEADEITLAYGIILMESASLIADLLKNSGQVATPSADEFNSDRGKSVGAAMEIPFIVSPFESRRSLSTSSRGAVTFGVVQCCYGTGVSCRGVYKQDAAAGEQVVHGNIQAAEPGA